MADYRVLWSPISSYTTIQGELPVTEFSWTETLNAPGMATGVMPLDPYPDNPAFQPLTVDTFPEGATVIWIVRDDAPIWSGILWGWDLDVAADTLTWHAEGWHSLIRRAYLIADAAFPVTEQADLVSSLVEIYAGSILGYGIVTSDPFPTTVNRELILTSSDPRSIGQIVEDMARDSGGFDFRYRTYDDAGAWRVSFDITWPAQGANTGLVFDIDSNIAAMNIHSDATNLAGTIYAFGSGQGSEAIVSSAVNNDLLLAAYPNLGLVNSYPDVTDTAVLAALNTRDALRAANPVRMIDLEVWPDTSPTVTDYQVGDNVQVTAQRGFLQMAGDNYRVVSRTVDVDPNGVEHVRLTLSPAVLFG